jgi:hypothetical protein
VARLVELQLAYALKIRPLFVALHHKNDVAEQFPFLILLKFYSYVIKQAERSFSFFIFDIKHQRY